MRNKTPPYLHPQTQDRRAAEACYTEIGYKRATDVGKEDAKMQSAECRATSEEPQVQSQSR